MLQEPYEIALKRKRAQETFCILEQAFRVIDELPLEADTIEMSLSLPKIHGLPSNYFYTMNGDSSELDTAPKKPRSRKSSHFEELHATLHGHTDFNVGAGRYSSLVGGWEVYNYVNSSH